MNLKKIIIAIAMTSISGTALAGACTTGNAHAAKIEQRKSSIKTQVAGQIDLTVDVSNSPFIYTNPDAGCDLGFSMPGLPDIGIGLDGIDACKVLQAVTGDMVADINKQMQDAVDGAIEDVTGGQTDFDIDLGEIVTDEIKGDG